MPRSTLLVIPTELEIQALRGRSDHVGWDGPIELCGFGPIASAARTAQLIAERRPKRMILGGIAGTLDPDRFPVGSATEFSAVRIDGIGCGEGETALGIHALGFAQWPGSPPATAAIGETLTLGSAEPGSPVLLTVCSASDRAELARRRRHLHPDAVAEDMEGFGVAVACALAGVPLRIVRGIANVAGDRQKGNWRLPAALGAVNARLVRMKAWETP